MNESNKKITKVKTNNSNQKQINKKRKRQKTSHINKIVKSKNKNIDPKDKKIKLLTEKIKKLQSEIKTISASSLVINGKKCHFCEKVLKKNMNIYSEPRTGRLHCLLCTKKIFK